MKISLILKKVHLSFFLILTVLLTGCQKADADPDLTEANDTESSERTAVMNLALSDNLGFAETLRISELMPSNGDYIYDQDGDSSDWLEIVNTGSEAVSLKGCSLSIRNHNQEFWQFPDILLAEGDRIVVFCSGKDRSEPELHSSFTLDKNGGTVDLYSSAGQLVDSAEYPEMAKDMSIVFLMDDDSSDSANAQNLRYQATPGFPNSADGYEDYLIVADLHGSLIINEAVSYNDTFPEKTNRYYDWLELKNCSEETIFLGDYYLSDQSAQPMMTHLPDVTLKPGELFIVYCSGSSALSSNTYFHSDFSIGADDRIYLTDKNGNLSDRLYLHDIPLNGSIGRMDGQAGFWYFQRPTPGKENGTGYRSISPAPTASIKSGVYTTAEAFQVELSGNGEIYYTLDGSIPDSSDHLYTEPITVTKTTVLRAICLEENSMCSAPATFSYILNEDDSLPVTSLVCEPNQMFGYNGVYGAPRALNSKCDASVSFFDENGDGFTADCSVELHGAHSRTTFKKKSFELKFSSRYGGDLEYDLFGDGIRTRFSSLLLRGGSSANLDIVRDCFASACMLETCPWMYPQSTRYTSVYINGEYYGIYAWREAYSEQYFADHTGMPEDGIRIARGPVSGGELFQLLNEISGSSAASDSAYERISAQLDLNSLAGWMAIQSFFDNQDINGNIRYVRLSEEGKWQLIVYDLDYCCLTNKTGWETVLASYQIGPVCRTMLTNQQFRELLLDTCAELYQNGFTTDHISELYDELLAPLDEDTIKKDCQRWGDEVSKWEKNKKAMQIHLSDTRMVDWLAKLKSLTKASTEQMHEYFPQYY